MTPCANCKAEKQKHSRLGPLLVCLALDSVLQRGGHVAVELSHKSGGGSLEYWMRGHNDRKHRVNLHHRVCRFVVIARTRIHGHGTRFHPILHPLKPCCPRSQTPCRLAIVYRYSGTTESLFGQTVVQQTRALLASRYSGRYFMVQTRAGSAGC